MPIEAFESNEAIEHVRAFVEAQRRVAALPRQGELLVEHVRLDEGGRALVLHALLGRRANEALARALAPRWGAWKGSIVAETGLALLDGPAQRPTARALAALFADPLESTLRGALLDSEAMRRRFRAVAERALLLRDPKPGQSQRSAGWYLRVWSDDAPDHPLLREAWREVLEERMDLRAAEAFRASVAAGDVELRLLPAAPHVSPYGACILHPRSGTGSDRAAALRDHVERWVEKVGAPRRGGG